MPEQTNLKRTDNRVKICAFGNSGRRDKLAYQPSSDLSPGALLFQFCESGSNKCPDIEASYQRHLSLSPTLPAQGSANFLFFAAINNNDGFSLALLHQLIPETPHFAERLAVC